MVFSFFFAELNTEEFQKGKLFIMTDPLVSKGNMFTCKGPQNHMISDMWKDTVKREIRVAKRFAARSQSVEILDDGLRTAQYTKASNEIGKGTILNACLRVQEVDRGIDFPNAGHQPILATTFFRKSGVF